MDTLYDAMIGCAQDRWGFVFYRCTYGNDTDWQRFKQIIQEFTESRTSNSVDPELIHSLECTFVEDINSLNGATREDLRQRFRAWREDAVKAEQPRAKPKKIYPSFGYDYFHGNPRYHLFIQVDEETLHSVVSDPKLLERSAEPMRRIYPGPGTVKLIDANWQPTTEESIQKHATRVTRGKITAAAAAHILHMREELEEEKSRNEPIDGCCEDYVGWVHVHTGYALTDGYDEAWGLATDLTLVTLPDETPYWRWKYKRPPLKVRGGLFD